MPFKSFSPSIFFQSLYLLSQWALFKYQLLSFLIDNHHHVLPHYLCRVFRLVFHFIFNTIILTGLWVRQKRNIFCFTDQKAVSQKDYRGYQLIVPIQVSKALSSLCGPTCYHCRPTYLAYCSGILITSFHFVSNLFWQQFVR